MFGLELLKLLIKSVVPRIENTDLEAKRRASNHEVREREPAGDDHVVP